MNISRVLIMGAGQIAGGIAQCTASHGLNTTIYDPDESAVNRALRQVDRNLSRLVDKKRLTADQKAQALLNIDGSTDLNNATRDTDLVIEASAKSLDRKQELFRLLEQLCPGHCILASNSSFFPVTALAGRSACPDRIIGLHFFTPVPLMKMVEIVRSYETSDATFRAVRDFCEKIGKESAEVEDSTGLVGNRLLMPYINEAIFAYMEGVASVEDIDRVARRGFNHPMGPLELADLLGLDTVLEIMEQLYLSFNDSKYRPCPLLRRMVTGGWLGRKSGRGFYNYESN
ncbi:MAG: 3-hydroxyacyl-CoA dehydrogenase NAD-binding domain-containing protein [Negativicutes bacterium]|nr:3-hydroxyacyl-CoA dehydrogenase NAD-binding domain-containing protein [Negativicutes bacterium]